MESRVAQLEVEELEVTLDVFKEAFGGILHNSVLQKQSQANSLLKGTSRTMPSFLAQISE